MKSLSDRYKNLAIELGFKFVKTTRQGYMYIQCMKNHKPIEVQVSYLKSRISEKNVCPKCRQDEANEKLIEEAKDFGYTIVTPKEDALRDHCGVFKVNRFYTLENLKEIIYKKKRDINATLETSD